MSSSWHGDEWERDRLPLWQVVAVLLLVSGVGPIAAAQLVWWLVTGDRLPA